MPKRLLPTIVPPHEGLERMGQAPRSALGASFRVIVWNMYKGRRRGWLEDLARLAEGTDLVLLQEAVLRKSNRDYFHTAASHEWIMGRSFVSEIRKEVTGVKTGAAVAADEAHVYFSPSREPLLRTPKLILVTRHPMAQGPPLLVLNVHAINFVSTAKFGEHLSQMHGVIADHPGPVLLGGDFNTWSRSRKDMLLGLIRELGMEQVAFNHGTGGSALGGNNQGKLRHLGQILDHVFYRGLVPHDAQVLKDIGPRAIG